MVCALSHFFIYSETYILKLKRYRLFNNLSLVFTWLYLNGNIHWNIACITEKNQNQTLNRVFYLVYSSLPVF